MKLFRTSAWLWLSLVACSCSSIEIRDVPVYWNLPNGGAVIAHTLSEDTQILAKKEWDVQRVGFASMGPEDYGWMKSVVEKLCSETRMCKPEDKEQIRKVFGRLDRARRRR